MKIKYPNQLIQKFFLAIVLSFSVATSYAHNAIEIIDISMPKVPSVSRTAAVYFTIINHSLNDITLVGVTTDVAKHAMFHQSKEENGVAKMRHMNELVIPAKSKLVFKPGSYHIMLMNIEHNLLSAPFIITLAFSDDTVSQFKVDTSQGNL